MQLRKRSFRMFSAVNYFLFTQRIEVTRDKAEIFDLE